jgi:hypothetical protein
MFSSSIMFDYVMLFVKGNMRYALTAMVFHNCPHIQRLWSKINPYSKLQIYLENEQEDPTMSMLYTSPSSTDDRVGNNRGRPLQ